MHGNAWSARDTLGIAGPDRVLSGADLAQHTAGHISHAAFPDSADLADGFPEGKEGEETRSVRECLRSLGCGGGIPD